MCWIAPSWTSCFPTTNTRSRTAGLALVPYLKSKHVGIMNAGPFAARLLTKATLPAWHKASEPIKAAARQAAALCQSRGVDIAQLAVQFSIADPDISTCVTGSANPANIRKWADWASLPLDRQLLAEVQQILRGDGPGPYRGPAGEQLTKQAFDSARRRCVYERAACWLQTGRAARPSIISLAFR